MPAAHTTTPAIANRAIIAVAILLTLAGCAAPTAPSSEPAPDAAADTSAEPGIATSCPDGFIDAVAADQMVAVEVTELDARAELDAIGLATLKPAPSCLFEYEIAPGRVNHVGVFIGAEEPFVDYVANQLELAGYIVAATEPGLVGYYSETSGQAASIGAQFHPDGSRSEWHEAVGAPFVELYYEGIVP